jgi:hypothetical protein
MSEPHSAAKPVKGALWAFGLVIIACLLLGLNQSQKQNQFVKPIPGGPPAPVVPKLPDIQARLAQAKTFCEDKAHQVKEAARLGRIKPKGSREGEDYYATAKAHYDGVIAYTCSAMQRGFEDKDEKIIFDKLGEANVKMMAFTSKADSLLAQHGAWGPLGDAIDLFPDWFKSLRKQNQEVIDKLKSDLEKCTMREWNQIPD